VDDDVLIKQCLPRVHTEEKKKLETGLIVAGTNNSIVIVEGRGQQMTRPWKTL
jgi:hypothetical protein